jgi:hypothetical protein
VADGKNYTIQPGDTLSKICAQNPDLGYSNWRELRDANIGDINRVGREQMAPLGIGEDVTRKPCGINGHNVPSHEIIGGIHYDEPSVPTIYPGTTLFLENKHEPPAEAPPQAEEEEFSVSEIHKEKWTGVEHQTPAPKLEIYTRGDPNNPDITYSADPQGGAYAKLLGYTFSESVDDLDGAFSFTVENEEVDKEGRKTVLDLIPNRSIIKIYEGDMERPVFVGIIRRPHIGMSMTSQGVKRTITFTGKSLISIVAEYAISLDIRIPGVGIAIAKTNQLKSDLAGVRTISNFLTKTWDFFDSVSDEVNRLANGVATTEIKEIILTFLGELDEFITVSGKEVDIAYDIANVFLNQSNNTLVDIWRNLLPKPVYEIFSYCNKDDGKPKIMVRQVPFGDPDNSNYDWRNLPIYRISPISLTAYELSRSDEEVYTFFVSYIIGSARDRNFYMAINQEGKTDGSVIWDSDKVGIYGFRPLELNFNGYDRQGNTLNTENDRLSAALKKINEKAKNWYSRLDDMYTGSITICTDFNEPETNPRIGCRAKFLGGEFYINKADHTWNYGGTPTIKLTLSRGMMYDENGKMRPAEEGIIKNVGERLRELELEKT